MIVRILPRKLRGTIPAIPSKSEAHRALICAALADAPCILQMESISEDISATMRCLNAFGASIRRVGDQIHVQPIASIPDTCEADCGESGSTLRFLLPVAGALGIDARFIMHGRLPSRPIAPLDRELIRGGCTLSRPEANVLRICGHLSAGAYALPGDVSSQYISGMLFALPLLQGESRLQVVGKLESAGYIDMTLQTMAAFSAAPQGVDSGWRILGGRGYHSPQQLKIGGDWSNAAFWLCADAIPDCDVRVTGLDEASAQGDRRICTEIARMRAADRNGIVIDAADIPDLAPILAATACARGQSLQIIRAGRLRIKESDRLKSVSQTLRRMGGDVQETEDGLIVNGAQALRGGDVDACGDHRIAMMAAIASCACSDTLIIRGAEAVNKSYPAFWQDFARLGGCVEAIEEA